MIKKNCYLRICLMIFSAWRKVIKSVSKRNAVTLIQALAKITPH